MSVFPSVRDVLHEMHIHHIFCGNHSSKIEMNRAMHDFSTFQYSLHHGKQVKYITAHIKLL